ncbi:hypothetical protein LTR12_016710 [Friedmanniomyces endolithicus]|nr:hypothetical protein LTR12_016710 [Friedmanniomyces endolithicus]
MSNPAQEQTRHEKETADDANISLKPELTSVVRNAVQLYYKLTLNRFRSGLATAGAATAYFVTVGLLNAFGVFQQYYTSLYLAGESNFKISWLGAFATFCLFAFAAPAGILSDKVGPQIPIACGSVLLVVAVFMVSLCRQYWQFFLAQGLLVGLGCSFIAIPASSVVP